MTDWLTRDALAADLAALGVAPGDTLLVHAACSRIGKVLGGPEAIVAALRQALGPEGTLLAYLDWDAPWEDLTDAEGRVLPPWRDQVMPFDPARTRAARDNGVLAETIRTTPGAVRSGNPGGSFAAIGPRADWLTADQPLDYGLGPDGPLGRLVAAGGRVLMLGAPLDTMTLVHLAEYLAAIPDKRVLRKEVPFAEPEGGIRWRWIEEFDSGDPCHPALPETFIERIVTEYLALGHGRQGRVGGAPSVLVEAAAILPFAVAWIERTVGAAQGPGGSG